MVNPSFSLSKEKSVSDVKSKQTLHEKVETSPKSLRRESLATLLDEKSIMISENMMDLIMTKNKAEESEQILISENMMDLIMTKNKAEESQITQSIGAEDAKKQQPHMFFIFQAKLTSN